jgi:hypothetical protein
MRLQIELYKPRSRSISFDTVQNKDIISTVTILKERQRVNAKRNIPVSAKIHAQTLLDLSALSGATKNSSLLPVANYLSLSLKYKHQVEVYVKMEDICEDLNLSVKSVIKALDILEEKLLIKRAGKSRYEISPKLAFFGEPFEWSIALEHEEQGMDFVLNKIAEIQQQIKQADKEHLINLEGKLL